MAYINRIHNPAHYSEFEPYAAQWLRNLMKDGHIAPGFVDERSIVDIHPDDLDEFTQCHFFAGVGTWSYAFRRAGVPDSARVWSGSPPCQGFSTAGKQKGMNDDRHLWPNLFDLIDAKRPALFIGEEVSTKLVVGGAGGQYAASDFDAEKIAGSDPEAWFDLVQSDLEGASYASSALDLPAAGFGAPHIRQRLYFSAYDFILATSGGPERVDGFSDRMANRERDGWDWRAGHGDPAAPRQRRTEPTHGSAPDGLADDTHGGLVQARERISEAGGDGPLGDGAAGRMADSERPGPQGRDERRDSAGELSAWQGGVVSGSSPTSDYWGAADWVYCSDEKWRPVEPGVEPLVGRVASRVGRLRAYGNGIVAPQAQAYVESVIDSIPLAIRCAILV